MTGRSCGEQINATRRSRLCPATTASAVARMSRSIAGRVEIEERAALTDSARLDQLLLETRLDRDRREHALGRGLRGDRRRQHLTRGFDELLPITRVIAARAVTASRMRTRSRIGTMSSSSARSTAWISASDTPFAPMSSSSAGALHAQSVDQLLHVLARQQRAGVAAHDIGQVRHEHRAAIDDRLPREPR